MLKVLVTGLAFIASITVAAVAQDMSKSAPDAKVMIVEPVDGATVSNPVTVKFALSGMTLAPAGDPAPNSGHHHLLIDQQLADPKSNIPADEKHKHFGKAQTETSITLTPGDHTLQLVLGDANHIPHDPIVQSAPIKITVR